MGKIDTAKKLLKLASRRSGSYRKAMKYAVKYGFYGLRRRFHDEIVMESVSVPKELSEPGSVSGSIKFSVLMPVHDVDTRLLDLAIQSVQNQTYDNWELCIVDDASTRIEISLYLKSLNCETIKFKRLSLNSGISLASNAAAEMATGDYLVFLDNDDEIHPSALAELFLYAVRTQADILYTDNEVIDEKGVRIAALHKPDWSPDLMRCQMYIGHLAACKRELFESVGGFKPEYDGAQDYDLFLRMASDARTIEHIPKILYSWRAISSSTSTNPQSKPYAQTAGKCAIQSSLDREYGKGTCRVDDTENMFVYDVRYPIPDKVMVSIIIPTKDHVGDLKTAVSSIFDKTDYPLYEILILNNNSVEKETFGYFSFLMAKYSNVRVIEASYAFNWSKLNNQGVSEAVGDICVFLNNDIEIVSTDWLTRLAENALRDDIGVVGGLLLYPDGSIQHAGVVMGMGGWADHVYKGMKPLHNGNPFISPMVTRNVSAVTGACMAISRRTLDTIGGFDESFIVCGSDVEICLRAEKHGLRNIYSPFIQLVHYESKTRNPKDIPAVDFKLSERAYRERVSSGDPYYNSNLDYMSVVPRVLSNREKLRRDISNQMWVSEDEVRPIHFKRSEQYEGMRITLLLPSVNSKDIYGGISTALSFLNCMVEKHGCSARIVVLDNEPCKADVLEGFPDYDLVQLGEESLSPKSIVSAFAREKEELSVSPREWFIATSWWSAYCYQEEYERQKALDGGISLNPLIYLIQDYEPGFYPWSTQYLLAQSTYQSLTPVYAVFNSNELKTFFRNEGYSFESCYSFEPSLNNDLASYLLATGGKMAKRRQILIYGRPNTPRNTFELIVESLREWIENDESSIVWEIVSAGEQHPPVYLARGRYLVSVGKQSLKGYAQLLSESYAGISLMVSPHPSYPPLEMASFGVKVVTNAYEGKDLSCFSSNILSLHRTTPREISRSLSEICSGYQPEVCCAQVSSSYLKQKEPFAFIDDLAEKMASYNDCVSGVGITAVS